MKLRIVSTVVGAAAVVAGIGMLNIPAAIIIVGVFLAVFGLISDMERP